jgi:glucose/arabinose dehydrogenase
MLVTERPGRLRVVTRDGKLSPPVTDVPQVRASGQGGTARCRARPRLRLQQDDLFLLRRARLGWRAAPRWPRARFSDGEAPQLDDVKVIFRQEGPLSCGNHYGCRIVQGRDGNLWLTMGDHFSYRDEAQNLANHLGKIVRVTPDGAVPKDNPFVGRNDAKPEIWSYGHRNAQGAALHPQTGKLWEHEHGPKGGDEVNIPLAGKNYGWPVIGYGINYDGTKAMRRPPSPAWSSRSNTGCRRSRPPAWRSTRRTCSPAWKGNLFVGALAGQMLVRLELDGEKVTREERL